MTNWKDDRIETPPAAVNTDRHLFTDEKGNSCHMTKDGRLGINVGGCVAVLPLEQWFGCLREVFPKPDRSDYRADGAQRWQS